MTAMIPAGASAATRRCPGCTTRIPLTDHWCPDCGARLPFHLTQRVSAAYRRDEHAYQLAVHKARLWLRANPDEDEDEDPRPAWATLAEQLQDMADMLTGIGRHTTHERRQVGDCAVCSCGVRVQGQLS